MNDFDSIQYLILDVDGTLTDGSIYYDSTGNEIKKFSVKDGAGIILAQSFGIKCVIITGRESVMVQRRADDLEIKYVFQNIKNKSVFLSEFMKTMQITSENLAYCGDDINDLHAMRFASFVCCPADAAKEVQQISQYISSKVGGDGAVRDCIEFMLKKRSKTE